MQSMRESAATAKAGMEKAKTLMQEKVEKMKTSDPTEKEMARERKETRKEEAEKRKQEARNQNATASQAGFAAGGFTNTTTTGSGYDSSRRVGYNENVGTRKNDGFNEDDPYFGTYE